MRDGSQANPGMSNAIAPVMTDDEDIREELDQDDSESESKPESESGKAGWALLWLLGIPLPVLLIAYLVTRGC